jgi:hypothetical protein
MNWKACFDGSTRSSGLKLHDPGLLLHSLLAPPS